MKTIEQLAREYAGDMLKYHSERFTAIKDYVCDLIADAYVQGWIDRDTKDDKPESLDEFLDISPDCAYFDRGYCRKALPDIICERSKCVAFIKRKDQC